MANVVASRLILASASPRRKELLAELGLPFEVIPAEVIEYEAADADPRAMVLHNAALKADWVAARHPDATVIGADTTVFVDRTAPGDRILARIEQAGGVWKGRMLERLASGPERVEAPCPINDRCGGCDWMHLSPSLQQKTKTDGVVKILETLGRIPPGNYRLLPLRTAEPALGARGRATLRYQSGQLVFFEGRSHQTVAVDRCIALTPELQALPGQLSERLRPISKDVETVQLLAANGKISFALKLRGEIREKHRELVEQAVRATGCRGAVVTPSKGRELLVGKPKLQAVPTAGEASRWLRPDAFTQAHEQLNRELVAAAIRALDLQPQQRVLELFSGNGNFTFSAIAAGGRVTAIESSRVTVDLARASAEAFKTDQVRFVLGDAETVCKGLRAEGARFDRLLLDPPRAGFVPCAEYAQALGVERVVYVSCNPASLARDARALVEAGFQAESVEPFEMFPQTHHVEVLMTFAKRPIQPAL